jgi:hypothetical protein
MNRMQFQIGEKVKVTATGRIGEIKAYRQEGWNINGRIDETIKYYVFFPPYSNEWYKEEQLQHVLEVDRKFESNFLDYLIDMNLKDGNFDMVKNYHNQKKKLG